MGYELYITRADSCTRSGHALIGADEWLAIVEEDSELRLAGYNGPYLALWNGPSKYPDPWLDWFNGRIYSKNPDDVLIEKMAQIAARLEAKLLGDDGESYVGRDDLNRLLWALQALAQPADVQLHLLSGCNQIPSKLWLDFERSSEIFDADGRGPANLTTEWGGRGSKSAIATAIDEGGIEQKCLDGRCIG